MNDDTTGKSAREMIDSHHHIWRQDDLAWLTGPMQPRIFGPYESIRRDYPASEYIAEAKAAGVTGSVYVQTNWPKGRENDEVRWIAEVHEQTGWPMAMVSYANLFEADAIDVLRAQQAITPLVKGARIQLHWHDIESYRFAARPDSLNDPVLGANLERLPELGLAFDLQVFSGQMQMAAELVARHPDVRFVLVHAGMLEASDDESIARWKTGMRQLAALPNLSVKLTGQGTFVHRLDTALIDLVTEEMMAAFGAERLMWGSNFPIEKIWTSFGELASAWKLALGKYSQRDQDMVFAGTAKRVYRIGE